MWILLPPTVAYSVAHYIVACVTSQVSSRLFALCNRLAEERNGAVSRPGIDRTMDAHREQVSYFGEYFANYYVIPNNIYALC